MQKLFLSITLLTSVAMITSFYTPLRAMMKPELEIKGIDLAQPIDLGEGNFVSLTEKNLANRLLTMKIQPEKGGRYAIGNAYAIIPTNSAIRKISDKQFGSLTPDEIRGLLITMTASLRVEQNAPGALVQDELRNTRFGENPNVFFDFAGQQIIGSGEKAQTVSIENLKDAFISLKNKVFKEEIEKAKISQTKVGLPIDLGGGNSVYLINPNLDTVLLNMKIQPEQGGRYAIGNTYALIPAKSAIDKISNKQFGSLTLDEIRGLLITLSAFLRIETIPDAQFLDDKNNTLFAENKNVLFDFGGQRIVGAGINAQTINLEDLRNAYNDLKTEARKKNPLGIEGRMGW